MLRSLTPFLVLAIAATSPAQWVDKTPANPLQTPGPRVSPAMCWDAAHGYILMCGGMPSPFTSSSPNETWTWNGTTWTRKMTSTPWPQWNWDHPSFAAMAFHAPTNQAVLCWGAGIFVWNGTDWLQHPNQLPIPTIPITGNYVNVAMAYDPVSTQLVLFVGTLWQNQSSTNYPLGYTFTFDGVSWIRRQTGLTPWPAQYPTMAFDPVANRLVLGTHGTTGAAFFEWTGTNWQQRLPAGAPAAAGVFATDTAQNRLVMFDGDLALQPGHTWTLANGTLQSIATPLEPGRRFGAAMAYDPVRQRTVLFGGSTNWVQGQSYSNSYLGDTWEFALPAGASFTPYGTGCLGSHGVPAVAASLGSLPRVGQPFSTVVTGLPLQGLSFMFLGLSNTAYGPTPLPLSLGFLGAPGCSVLASGDDLGLVTNVLGTGVWQWNVPNAPGASFYVQAFAFDAAANPLGITTSNGGHGVIGF
ncbi:MAG: hypothetical protein JNK15_22780 [Planctomycetes bacterium]|nr:hypothetical protein [Planctomycetota bacterium]